MVELFANSGEPYQMLHSAASDLGLLCLPVMLYGVSRQQWVKIAVKIMATHFVSLFDRCFTFALKLHNLSRLHFWADSADDKLMTL